MLAECLVGRFIYVYKNYEKNVFDMKDKAKNLKTLFFQTLFSD